MDEIEMHFLDVDVAVVETKLKELGAVRESEETLEEWIYKKPEWKNVNGRLRIRRKSMKSEECKVAYKEFTQDVADGNLEIEFKMEHFKEAVLFVEKMGLPLSRHQQKKRIHYSIDNMEVDIDFWPLIPPYVEIEGPSREAVEALAVKLGFDPAKASGLDNFYIYKDVYGINVDEIKELVF